MVVVDNARKMISKTIDIAVTSVFADHRRQDDLRPFRRAHAHGARKEAPTGSRARSRRGRRVGVEVRGRARGVARFRPPPLICEN